MPVFVGDGQGVLQALRALPFLTPIVTYCNSVFCCARMVSFDFRWHAQHGMAPFQHLWHA